LFELPAPTHSDAIHSKRQNGSEPGKAETAEAVCFFLYLFKSRVHRDTVNAKVMKDTKLAKMVNSEAMPFDSKRMAYGGFKVLVDA
jgi:uncharacterized protein YbaA (DUF1428 family)